MSQTPQPPASEAAAPHTSERPRVQAYVLVQTHVGRAHEVAAAIRTVPGVVLAEGITGPYDVVVRAEADSVDELGAMVVAKVQAVPGITRTVTCPVVHL